MRQLVRLLLVLGVAATSLLPMVAPARGAAQASQSVRYSVSPSSGSAESGELIDIDISVRTDIELGGGNVHLVFNNASYHSDVAKSKSNPAAFDHIDYMDDYDDLLFICHQNRCAPGTYHIATVTIKVGDAGNATVAFNPKETANPSLSLIGATGTNATFKVAKGASSGGSGPYVGQPSTGGTKKPGENEVTVPQDDGNGGTEPIAVDNEQYSQLRQNGGTSTNGTQESGDSKSFWSAKNIVIGGISVAALFIIAMLVISKFFLGGGPKGPLGPSGGAGPTITPGDGGPIYTR